MRYKLENSAPVEIRKVVFDGLTITNPTDAFIDAHGLGYPKEETPAPAYDPDEEKISFEWSVVDGTIKKVWTVTELSTAEKAAIHNARIDEQINAVNSAYEAYKTTPLSYAFNGQTMTLKPIWVTEYYGTLMQIGLMTNGANFPTTITDAAGTNFEMTFAEFQTMFLWLVGKAQTEIKRVNDSIAELQAQKEDPNG